MASNPSIANEAEEMRREEERRKRPDVQRYKPGAFNRKPEPLFPEGSFKPEIRTVGTGSERNKENRRGGQGVTEQIGNKDKRRKPEKEHFAPKKVVHESNDGGKSGSRVEENSIIQDTGGGTNTRKKKNKKNKSKDKDKTIVTVAASEEKAVTKPKPSPLLNGDDDKPAQVEKKLEKSQHDDIPIRNNYSGTAERNSGRKYRDKRYSQIDNQVGKNRDKQIPKSDNIDMKDRDNRNPKPDNQDGKDQEKQNPKSENQEGRDHVFRVPDPVSRNYQEKRSDRRGHVSDKRDYKPSRDDRGLEFYEQGSGKREINSELGERLESWGRGGGRNENGFQRSDRGGDFRSHRGFSGSERRSDRDLRGSGHGMRGADRNRFNRDVPQGRSQGMDHYPRGDSEPKENGRTSWKQDQFSRGGRRGGSRGSSPQRGGRGRWSQGSSPSRSSRGNSPTRANSRPSSRRTSPSFHHSRTNSPVRHTRVFRKNNSPPSQRSTVSRTPSPRSRRNQDTRDLDGYTRDQRRRDEGLWDPQGKPPSGRVKSAPVKTSLPPRFQKTKEREISRRLENETCHMSDWSVEMEEEDERKSQLGLSPPSGPGIIRVSEPQTGSALELRAQPIRPGTYSAPFHPSWNQTLPSNMSAEKEKFLFDPSNPMKPIRMQDMSARDRLDKSYPEFSGPTNPNMRFPMGVSRFNPPPQMYPPNMIPMHPGPGAGYQPPFPQPRMPTSGVAFHPAFHGPDWFNVFDSNIYGSGKIDINIIVRIVSADKKLRHLVQGGPAVICNRWDQEVREIRHEIMKAARLLLQTDLYFVCEKDVDAYIWKSVYYQVIEMLKFPFFDTENTTPETKQVLKSQLLVILEEGVDYFTQLLKDIGDQYHVDLDRFHDVLEPRDLDKTGRLALIICQKLLLYLGDLARYKEQVNSTSNYGRARQYYQKANHLDMRNGRPFNMLAILAKLSNRKFEAVYYNIRCLMSRNPFTPSSKEGLSVIFDEMKRRWELGEKQKLDKKVEENDKTNGSLLIKGSRVRREIWIRGEAGRRLHRTTSATATSESLSCDLDNLSITDLNKRFINTFLHLQGMLFTQINTEDIYLASKSLIEQFRILIGKTPLPISVDRLVQIMALNMYSIEKTKIRAGSDSPSYRSVMQTKALELAGEMFSVLLERCNLLIAGGNPEDILDIQSNLQQEITPLLAAVKVWCDWLIGNNDTWYPVVSAEPFTQLAQLATRLEAIKPTVTSVLEKCLSDETWRALPQARREEFDLIRLAEDSILCEFEPWFRGLDWSLYRQFSPKSVNHLCRQNAKRVDQIRMCAEVLEGLDPPVLKWSVPDNSHVCLVTDREESTQASVARDMAEANLTALIARDEDILEECYSDKENEEQDEPVNDEIAKLRMRKVELQKVQSEQARKAQKEILDQHVRTTLEVRPKILVPDTNAFIDHLDLIKLITVSGEFQLVIPIVVLGELEGLCKSKDYSDRPEHGAMLRENSKLALTWIRSKPKNVKCATTKGSILSSLGVTVEEDTRDGETNDDRILICCLNLDSSSQPRTEDGMKTVFRNTILLTDDRNLKLKAHIQDCAVSKVGDFVSWISDKQ